MSNSSDLLNKFIQYIIIERQLSKNTYLSYKCDIKDFICYIEKKEKDILKVDKSVISSYLSYLFSFGIKNNTYSRKISSLRHFYEFLLLDKHINQNPVEDVKMPKKELILPKILNIDDIGKIFEMAKKGRGFNDIRCYTILELLYSTGMRISECLSIPLYSVVRSDGRILSKTIITGKGGRDRPIFFNKNATKALRGYIDIRKNFLMVGKKNDYLFCSNTKEGYFSRVSFGVYLKKIALIAGIDETKISPHKIRHLFATRVFANGTDIKILQEILGHKDISTTEIYTHLGNSDIRKLIENYHPLAAY